MNTNTRTLNTADLTEGQQLALVIRRGGRWGAEIRRSEKLVTIKKVLKTRLVCVDERGHEYRFIVEYSKTFPYRNGEVSTDLEGERARDAVWTIRDAHMALFTTDDPTLIEGREADEARNAQVQAKQQAREALEAFKSSLSVEKAHEAITALQKFIDLEQA